eukprot:NODE_28_length_3482_cov_97.980924_g26_i0.p1 GENE.NODE_28_length_3482_cov_97.980924_g26_i0~~NODE_28_length_3482_cov_97.980924_g26_i0.p1  ORF type:complete len:1137 (-),score=257.18 NODE_28_length_3482_cov_97.980924_g26_i0:71-3001(-)
MDVVGSFVENERLVVEADYIGGAEGTSVFQWFREAGGSFDQPDWEPIEGAIGAAYVPSVHDVRKRLAVDYTPQSADGMAGDTNRFITEEILPSYPQLQHIMVRGLCKEAHALTVDFQYSGGHPGNHIVQWLRREEKDGQVQRVKIGKLNAMSYTPSKKDIGQILEVAFTPVRDDGVKGEPKMADCGAVIAPGHPSCIFMQIAGEPIENHTLTARTEYFGGTEGASTIFWYRNADEPGKFDQIPCTDQSYTCTGEDCHRRIKVVYTPVREDGLVGEPRFALSEIVAPNAPAVHGVRIDLVQLHVGQTVRAQYTYMGGAEGQHRHRWCRVYANGTEKIIVTYTGDTAQYTPTVEDIGCRLVYGIKPVRSDGVESEWVYSPPSSTPVLSDGISTADHNAIQLPPSVQVGNTVKPQIQGIVFDEKRSGYEWQRMLPTAAAAVVVGNQLSYTVTESDVNSHLRFVLLPITADGSVRATVDAITGPVLPADGALPSEDNVSKFPPRAANCELEGETTQTGVLIARVHYVGTAGQPEGRSLWRWYVIEGSGQEKLVPHVRSNKFRLSPNEVGKRIRFEYTPVSRDGVQGEPASAMSPTITAAPPQARDVSISGDAVDGGTLQASYTYYGGAEGQSQWRWFRERAGQQSEVITRRNMHTYTITGDDIGCRIKVQYTPVSLDGVSGDTVTASSPVVQEGAPKFETLSFNSECYCMKEIRMMASQYSGGQEGTHQWAWELAWGEAGPWAPVGANTSQYCPTADDITKLLRAQVTPVRADGLQGQTVYSRACQVDIEPNIHKQMISLLSPGHTAFNVRDLDGMRWDMQLGAASCKLRKQIPGDDRRSLEKVAEIRWSPSVSLDLDPQNDAVFHLVCPENPEPRFTFCVDKRVDRDMVALVFRLFHGLATPEIAMGIVSNQFLDDWARGSLRAMRRNGDAQGAIRLVESAFADGKVHYPPPTNLSPGVAAARQTLIAMKSTAYRQRRH